LINAIVNYENYFIIFLFYTNNKLVCINNILAKNLTDYSTFSYPDYIFRQQYCYIENKAVKTFGSIGDKLSPD